MKKALGLLFATSLFNVVFAQTPITISFEIDQNGSQLLLDSVLIENQTISTDTTIYFPETTLELDMLSGIDNIIGESNTLRVVHNYPNPFYEVTNIEVYNPGKELSVQVCDLSGKVIFKNNFVTEKGLNLFKFYAGADSQYIVGFQSGNQVQNIKLVHQGEGKSNCKIEYVTKIADLDLKSTKNIDFTYTEGENLVFTSYSTACFEVEESTTTGSPAEDVSYSFDYTGLTEIQPDAPVAVPAVVEETSIVWDWNDVENVDGYKYNSVDDYATATDIGNTSGLEQNGLDIGTYYVLYVWAYNSCGESFSTQIVEATETTTLSQEENDLIISGTSGQSFTVMHICEQPDSLILRNLSTNVDLGEENLQLLVDRLKMTVLEENGVGIAAPQIGINRNIIWVQRYDKGGAIKPWEVYYNPVIIAYSDTLALRSDGCLSVPGDCVSEYGIQGNSYRSIWIDIQYYDEDFNLVQERITHEFTAHIFQHEIDHLNGVMYFDRQVEEVPEKYVIVEGESYEGLPVID